MKINDASRIGETIGNYYIKKSNIEVTQYNAPLFFYDIIRRKGASYLECDMSEKVLGHTLKDELGVSIMINKNITGPRKHFTLAHEIGHLLMHVDKSLHMETEKTISNDQNIDVAEKEANAFAAKLLLPDKVLTNQILSGYTIHDISNISNISKQAIYWRIVGFAMDNLYAKHAEAMGYADEYKRTHKNSEVIKTSIHSLIYDRRLSTLSFDYG